jgi:hypothetical protein
MMKKMKMMKRKTSLFLLLTIIFGAANVCAQVRIGGNQIPHPAAVLDLNVSDATIDGKLGLSLPRVSLVAPETTLENGVTPKDGTLVYNTNAGFSGGLGLYYWYDTRWIKLDTHSVYGSGSVEVDSVIGNEVLNATTGRGLARAGAGTAVSPYTLGIDDNGVTTDMINAGAVTTAKIMDANVTTAKIADKAVTYAKIDDANASSGQVLKHDGSGWAPAADEQGLTSASNGLTVSGNEVKLGGMLSAKATIITTHPLMPLVIDGDGGFCYVGDGKVGIGMQPNTSSATFEVYGAAANMEAYNAGSSRTIDFSRSNLAYTTERAGPFTLTNLKDGATYTLAVQGLSSGVSTFTATNTVGDPLTVKVLNNTLTVLGKETLYTIIVMDTTAYVFVATGF